MTAQSWKPTKIEDKYGVAIYNFHAETILHGLSLHIGDTVQIFEECGEWFKGRLMKNVHRKGIFPKNSIKQKEAGLSNPGPYEIVTPVAEAIVEEVTTVLREWGNILKDLFLERKTRVFLALKLVMNELISYRREIIYGKLTQDQQSEIREKITLKVDTMNRKLKLDLVPRLDGDIVDPDHISVVELFKVHLDSSERTNPQSKRPQSKQTISSGLKTIGKFSTFRKTPVATKGALTHHLFLTFKSFVCNIGDASTLLLALYDIRTGKYISEGYMIKLTKHGMPVDIELLGKQFGIFTDLTSADLQKTVCLVCKIFRQGKLVAESKKVANAEYRRPFGVGVKDISGVLKADNEDETELYIQIYNCNELDFGTIEDYIINKQTNKFSTFGSNSFSVCVGVKLCHGDVDKIIKEKGQCALTPRLGFPEVILPGYVRNDFYVTLNKADFEKGSKSSGKNIEVALCAVSERGQVFNDCMYIGSGDKPVSEYRSYVLYHTNSPTWNETIKISLPIEQFHTAHLRFTFSHCSRNEGKVKGERIFGFSYVKLLKPDGTVIKDQPYSLFIYKYDNSINFASVQSYLRLAPNSEVLSAQEKSGVVFAGPPRNPKESLSINTFLCSTKLTQNSDIVHLLRWRKMKPNEILIALEALLKVSPEEVVKFLQDVFDALFNLLSEDHNEFSLPVFKALVSITKIVEDRKYEQFKSVLETYVEEHFSSTLAFKSLVSSLCLVIQKASNSKFKNTLKNSMQSLDFICKVTIRSFQLYNSSLNSTEEIQSFKEILRTMFTNLNEMMATTNELLNEPKEKGSISKRSRKAGKSTVICDVFSGKGTSQDVGVKNQIDVLKKLPKLCNDMLVVFDEKEFSECVHTIVDSVPNTSNSTVQVQRLICIREIVETHLFMHAGGRSILMPLALRYLCFHMSKKHELSICLDLLGDIITAMQNLPSADVSSDVTLLSSSLLSILLNVILTIDRRGQTLTALAVSCLLGILQSMGEKHYEIYFQNYENKIDLRDFLKKLTVTFKELLIMDIFPKDWFVLKAVTNKCINCGVPYEKGAIERRLCQYSGEVINERLFVTFSKEKALFKDADVKIQLWQNYFQLAVLFLTQKSLHVETFPATKREKMLARYGDMRIIMCFEILAMWDYLGEKKKFFIPGLIGAFLEMTLIPELELRKASIPIFYDMMEVEFAETHTFKKVEEELIEKLEVFMNKSKGDLEFEQLFEEMKKELHKTLTPKISMTKKFEECRDPTLYKEGLKAVHSITELLKRLLDYRAATTDDSNNDQKMMCTVRLLEFYKDLDRQRMYVKCIYKLVELHIMCSNYTEAAFTLQLYASLLEWRDSELPAFLTYPKQQECQRKEQLYLEIINYFDKGKTWERGIRLCKELADLYENKNVDYTKLSEILRKQAYFYDNIMKQMRPAPTYFRVCFYGRGFPHYLKDEILIYRGQELETLAGFTTRMKTEFPAAEILYKNTPPDVSIVQGIGQHIQICSVNPISSESGLFGMKNVDEKISSYFKVNEVNQFVFSRPYHKGEKDKNNEFKTLWLERTMHWTKRKLPGILKWSTIESTRKTDLTPIENAIESILSKNRELSSKIDEYKTNPTLNVNPLSMILNGIIDANVNGGIANYQSAFLSDEYLFLNPEDEEKVNHLKNLLQEQSNSLQSGLAVHENFMNDSLRPFHEKMVMMFSAMKISLETGQPMENVLSRPSSLTLNSSLTDRSSPKNNNSPKGSPLEARRGLNNSQKAGSDGDINVNKRDKSGKLSSSLQNMFRRSSVQYTSHDMPSPGEQKKGPPLPPRRVSTPSMSSDSEISSPGMDLPQDLPPAALKRLGLQPPGLAQSAPSLAFIEEEETPPSLPPRTRSMKRHSAVSMDKQSPRSTFFADVQQSDAISNSGTDNTDSESINSSLGHYEKLTDVTSVSSLDFQTPTVVDLENAKLYDNVLNTTVNNEEDFYDSPKELLPPIYFTDDTPPVPAPRRFSREVDESKLPKLPSRVPRERKPSMAEDTMASSAEDTPPPLPKRNRRTSTLMD